MAKDANSMETLRRQLANRHRQQQVAAMIAYRRLVLMLANDEDAERDHDEIETVLANAEKSNDQLFADVDRMKRRIGLVRILDSKPEVIRQQGENGDQLHRFIVEREEERREMAQRHTKIESELRTKENELRMKLGACEQAMFELWTIPIDADDEREEASINEELAEVRQTMYFRQKADLDHATGIRRDPSYLALVDREERLKFRLAEMRKERTKLPNLENEEAALSQLED